MCNCGEIKASGCWIRRRLRGKTMLDILGMVGTLQRPRLLVRAARFGVDDYSRNAMLPRVLHLVALPRSGDAILRLLDIEAEMNDLRLLEAADYSIARHVEVLIALMGEARLLRATTRQAEPVT